MKNVVLIADKNSKAWDFAKKIQEYISANKSEDIILENIPISFFRNGEIRFDSTISLRKKDVYFIQDSSKNPQQWWVELLLVKDSILGSAAKSLTFVLPNLLYSRQDRKDKHRVPISARALANSISSGINKIITMELHAPQIQGFYPDSTPLENLHSFTEIVDYLVKNHADFLDNLLIISPDTGGVARAKNFLNKVESKLSKKFELGFMYKSRSRPGEVGEIRYNGPDPSGKNILLLDDIIDSGGTLCKSSELLKSMGASKLYAYATHGLFTEGTEKLKTYFDKILISNTHHSEPNGIEVIDISGIFAEAIYREQKGESISELFN